MALPDAIAAPRASQRNAALTQAEPAFMSDPVSAALTSQYGEQFKTVTGPVLPLNSWIGNATGIEYLGRGRYQAAAEPVRNRRRQRAGGPPGRDPSPDLGSAGRAERTRACIDRGPRSRTRSARHRQVAGIEQRAVERRQVEPVAERGP